MKQGIQLQGQNLSSSDIVFIEAIEKTRGIKRASVEGGSKESGLDDDINKADRQSDDPESEGDDDLQPHQAKSKEKKRKGIKVN